MLLAQHHEVMEVGATSLTGAIADTRVASSRRRASVASPGSASQRGEPGTVQACTASASDAAGGPTLACDNRRYRLLGQFARRHRQVTYALTPRMGRPSHRSTKRSTSKSARSMTQNHQGGIG